MSKCRIISSAQLINENLLLGVGNGDVRDELSKVYIQNNFYESFTKRLNSHNQFIQTWIAVGIIGLIILISIFGFTSVVAFKKRNFIALGICLLLFVNFLTESMLETQSGVIFFSFFISFIFRRDLID